LLARVESWWIHERLNLNKIIDHTDMNINSCSEIVLNKMKKPLEVEGGKVFVNRLVHLFGLRSKVELSELIGVSTGSLATWQTRNAVPYELAIRLHLATGVSLEYLLFEELKGNYDVMLYAPNHITQPNYANIKHNLNIFHYSICQPINYYGGAVLIERLVSIFKVSSKKEMGELFSVSMGTLSTWHTRKITPHELLCRIHLATGISMHFLCFGREWEEGQQQRSINLPSSSEASNKGMLDNGLQSCEQTYELDNGQLKLSSKYVANDLFWSKIGINPPSDMVVIGLSELYFINVTFKKVTKGQYLFSINDSYQIGELRQLPDGNVYLIDGHDKYPFNTDTTKIHGKVVSILQSV
jgi:hypothetical protein